MTRWRHNPSEEYFASPNILAARDRQQAAHPSLQCREQKQLQRRSVSALARQRTQLISGVAEGSRGPGNKPGNENIYAP